MAETYTSKTAQCRFSDVGHEATDRPVTITKQGKAAALMMSIDRMEAIAETMEILADPAAMSSIRAHREGRGVYHDVSRLDELQ